MSMPIIIGHFPRPCRSQRHVMNTIQNEKSVEREIYSLNWLIQRNVSAEITQNAQNAPTDQIELRMEIRQRSKQEELDRRKVVRVIMLSVMLLMLLMLVTLVSLVMAVLVVFVIMLVKVIRVVMLVVGQCC